MTVDCKRLARYDSFHARAEILNPKRVCNDTFVDLVEGRRWVKQYQENIIVIIKGQIYVIRKTQKGSLGAVISTVCWLSFSV